MANSGQPSDGQATGDTAFTDATTGVGPEPTTHASTSGTAASGVALTTVTGVSSSGVGAATPPANITLSGAQQPTTASQAASSSRGMPRGLPTVDDCFRSINALHAQVATFISANKAQASTAAGEARDIKRAAEEIRVERVVAARCHNMSDVHDADPDIDNEIAPWRHTGRCFSDIAKETEMAARWVEQSASDIPGADTIIAGLRSAFDKCGQGSDTARVVAQSIHMGASVNAPRAIVAAVGVESAAADVTGFAEAGGVPKSVATAYTAYKKDQETEAKKLKARRRDPTSKKSDEDAPTTPCPKCHKPGHWKRNCPLLAASPAAAAKQA